MEDNKRLENEKKEVLSQYGTKTIEFFYGIAIRNYNENEKINEIKIETVVVTNGR